MKVGEEVAASRSAASTACQKRFVAIRWTSAAAMPASERAAARSGAAVPRRGRNRRATAHHGRCQQRPDVRGDEARRERLPHGRASRGWSDGPRR